jgi:hypothetical protein
MTTLCKIGIVFCVAALPACDRSSDRTASDPDSHEAREEVREPVMQPASRVTSAARSIAEARCARENRCANVGSDKKYSSTDDCMARVSDDWKDDLNARECPGGINQTELQECLGAIRAEDCNSPFDTLDRVTECTSAQICIEDAARKPD